MTRATPLWLLRHELRLFIRSATEKSKLGLIVIAICLLVWSVLSVLLTLGIAEFLPAPPFPESGMRNVAYLILSVLLALTSSLMLSQAITGIVGQIYTRNDIDLLFSSPIRPWTVMLVRITAIALQTTTLYLCLFAPAIICLAIVSSPLWLCALAMILLSACLATGLALHIVLGLFRVMGPRRTRTLAQVLSALAGGAVFLTFQSYNLSGQRGDLLADLTRLASATVDETSFWIIPAKATLGDPVALAAFALVGVTLFTSGFYLFSRGIVSDAASALSNGQARARSKPTALGMKTHLAGAVLRKELRLLWRDPLLISRVGLQLVYGAPIFFAIFVAGSTTVTSPLGLSVFASGLTLIACSLATNLSWITLSAEDSPDLLASAPARTRQVERAKMAAALGPILILMTPPIGYLFLIAPSAGLWTAAGCIAGALSSAFIQAWRRAPGRREDFFRKTKSPSFSAFMGNAAVTSCVASAAAAGAIDLPWLALPSILIALAVLGALSPEPRRSSPLSTARTGVRPRAQV
jgi:ABC-2 type transport system permease protein